MEKEYVIGLNKEVDTVQFWQDVEKTTTLDNIPNRAVEVANPRSGSNRLTHYYLTDEEAEMIRQDKRVYCVEIPADQREDISIGFRATQTENFTKANDIDSNGNVDAVGSARNWGLLRSRYKTNNYGTSFDISGSYYYTSDGEGVDVVIQDSGIQKDHPEFTDKDGNSRVQEINWYTASGLSGSQSNLYTDYDGHGTHCAGIAAGKTFGFAKGARIYAQKLSGLEGSSDPYNGIPIADAFDTIRLWHLSKSGSRPTVVNMSWGYGTNLSAGGVTNINYRGTNYTSSSNIQSEFGIATYNSSETWRINARVSSVDVEIQEMIDAGIIVCIASGNLNYKIDVPSGLDYNNNFTHGGTDYYYHRGSSPYDDEAFIVGSVSYNSPSATTDKKSSFSNAGPGVNIYAPGHFIMSAESNVFNSDHTTANYNLNSSYKQAILSGTSMASPQVAGVAALALQGSPKAKPQSVREALINNATSNILISGSDPNGWSTGGNLINNRESAAGFGTQNEAVMASGRVNFPYCTCTEEYNGTSWSAGGATINARYGLTGFGTQNAGAISSGYIHPSNTNCTEEYDGSSWSAGGATINTHGAIPGAAGTQNEGIIFGGFNGSYLSCTEEYDGTSWTTGGALSTARYSLAGAGTQNSTLAAGGHPYKNRCTEEYNGSSWATGGAVISGRAGAGGGGTQNAGVIFGGYGYPGAHSCTTELYDGSSWSTSFNMIQARYNMGSAGTQASGLAFGGQGCNPTFNVLTCTEEFTSGNNYVPNCDYSSDSTMGGPTKMLWNRYGQDPSPISYSGSMNISTSILLS
jgi:subtilisin family serine protease